MSHLILLLGRIDQRENERLLSGAAIEAAGNTVPPRLADETGAEFDRIMKLLARHDRKPRGPECRFTPGGRRQRWIFERSIALPGKKLRAMGVKLGPLPPKALEDLARWGEHGEGDGAEE